MGNENEKINGPRHPLPLKLRDGLHRKMIGEIAREKDRGGDERRDHAVAMSSFVLPADEVVTECQKGRAQSIQAGVDGGEIGKGHGFISRGAIV